MKNLRKMEIAKDVFKKELVNTFCKYVEDDYYEWLKDNLNYFLTTEIPIGSE